MTDTDDLETDGRVGHGEALAQIEKVLTSILNTPHAEHFGPFCPVCGLTSATLLFVREWKP